MIAATDVTTKEDLVFFIKQLEREAASDECSWESVTLDSYLEAMSGWLDDVDGSSLSNMVHVKKEPIWKVFALMLDAATIYE